MAEQTPRPAKRARGSYAKLICFRCRERRIKCQLPDDGSVQPSSEPQPRETSCQRCRQQGLECIVRKTTLGRPNQKKKRFLSPHSAGSAKEESRSPTPETEHLVLLTLDEDKEGGRKRTSSTHDEAANVQMFGAVHRTFDLMSALLARDKKFGCSITALRDTVPKPLDRVVSADLAELLDQHLIWHKLYMPWLPSLSALHQEAFQSNNAGRSLSTTLLVALMSSIALDIPSESLAPYRHLQQELRCIVYHTGQKVLFSLPRHEHTLIVLELVHGHRPLSLIDTQQAAAHTLSGNLYSTLMNAFQQRLGLDRAPMKLRAALDNNTSRSDVLKLVLSSIRWCASLLFSFSLDLQDVETNRSEVYEPEVALRQALTTLSEAIDRHSLSEAFFLFHVLRFNADGWLAMREVTADRRSIPKLAGHIDAYIALRSERKRDFDEGLSRLFLCQGRVEEGLAMSQLAAMEQGQGHSDLVSLAMFYAIIGGAHALGNSDLDKLDPSFHLREFYTKRVIHQAREASNPVKSEISAFLDQHGDDHMDSLEKRLTDFINATTDVVVQGVPFVGPPRHTSSNVLMACRAIVENNAVRIKIDGGLHERVDTQLILFQEAARRLEGMEADGGTADAVARGSVFAASAKLVRSLHRIMWQWKRSYAIGSSTKQEQHQQQLRPAAAEVSSFADDSTDTVASDTGYASSALNPDNLFADAFFADWDNWQQLGPNDLSGLFTYDFDVGNML